MTLFLFLSNTVFRVVTDLRTYSTLTSRPTSVSYWRSTGVAAYPTRPVASLRHLSGSHPRGFHYKHILDFFSYVYKTVRFVDTRVQRLFQIKIPLFFYINERQTCSTIRLFRLLAVIYGVCVECFFLVEFLHRSSVDCLF